MFLPLINGPTEGLLIAVGASLVSYVYGAGWWQSPIDRSTALGNLILNCFSLLENKDFRLQLR